MVSAPAPSTLAACALTRPLARAPARPAAAAASWWRTFATAPQEPVKGNKVRSYAESEGRFSSLAYRSLGLMLLTGAAIYLYFDIEKEKARQVIEARNADQAVGKPKLGGPFSLIDTNGKPVTDADFRGKFMLLYFGFTNCPDVCPEELEKMATALDSLDPTVSAKITPIFISVDPKRDDIAAVRDYVAEFHPRLVGLTGTYDQVKAAAKAYRVYFSSPPPEENVDDDYLVDHSIFFYLMDPQGAFVDAYGKNLLADQVAARMRARVEAWEKTEGPIAA
ncbi:Cu-binding protein [Allomyces arbusculus]|nr:Cu-binding protein [Allomyces arbusculus]